MTQEQIVYQPYPGFQTEFLQCGAKEMFCGGEAGGGKSLLLIMDALNYIHEPNYHAIIFRRTFPELDHLITEASGIYPGLGGVYKSTDHSFEWPNGAKIQFSHMQHLKDMYKHQGHQYDYAGFDELPHFPLVMYIYIFSRVRGKNPNVKRYVRSTGNPDGPHKMWVKARFVDKMPANTTRYFLTKNDKDMEVPKGTINSISRCWIPCIRAENEALMKNDPDYEAMLEQLPEAQKRALKYGKWDTVDQPNQLVQSNWLEDALMGRNKFEDDNNYTIGCDFGHSGFDLSVEILGKGNKPYRVRSWKMTKTTEMATILYTSAGEVTKSRTRIGVDCIGPGAGVGDSLESMYPDISYRLERCTHKDPLYAPRFKGQIAFDNLRSQMCWKFREDMQDGLIDLSAFMQKDTTDPQNVDGYFEDLHLLQEEILVHTFDIVQGKLKVKSKNEIKKADNLGRSPNYFDALVIWNWTRRMHQPTSEGQVQSDIEKSYMVDLYMENFFKEDEDKDNAIYHEEYFDEGDYDY